MKTYKRQKLNLVATLTALTMTGSLGAKEGHEEESPESLK
jgi:hypothetical protein